MCTVSKTLNVTRCLKPKYTNYVTAREYHVTMQNCGNYYCQCITRNNINNNNNSRVPMVSN
jgi:hypothetical protein